MRLEYDDGARSHKFWEGTVNGKEFTAHWGPLGGTGQTQIKLFPTDAAAQAHLAKMINEKTRKGYILVDEPADGPTFVLPPLPRERVGHLAPQLATASEVGHITHYLDYEDWVLEQKLDGHRVMLVTGETTKFLTRGGMPYTKGIPAGLHDHGLNDGLVLDGELVDGVLWVFDLLTVDGKLDGMAQYVRRATLETVMLDVRTDRIRLVPQARTREEKRALFETARERGYEGVVAKRRLAGYTHGQRTDAWHKVKFVETVDVVVLTVGEDGKDSATLGVFDDGLLLEVGRCSLIGKETVRPGDVIEVKYLYAADPDEPRLTQPTMLRRRDDKRPDECLLSQIKFTDKTVMEVLVR